MSESKPLNGKTPAAKSEKQSVGPSVTKNDDSKDDTQDKVVPYLSLYRGIDGKDTLAISLGLLGSFVNGLTFPAFSFIFAEVRSGTLPLTLECISFDMLWRPINWLGTCCFQSEHVLYVLAWCGHIRALAVREQLYTPGVA